MRFMLLGSGTGTCGVEFFRGGPFVHPVLFEGPPTYFPLGVTFTRYFSSPPGVNRV